MPRVLSFNSIISQVSHTRVLSQDLRHFQSRVTVNADTPISTSTLTTTTEMSRNYSITEPHPSVPTTHMAGYGRGGAGNMVRVNPSNITTGATATGPASAGKLRSPQANAYFSTGRGGAGNVHKETERAIFSFDEELARQQKMMDHQTPYYHVGRGGAGNLIDEYSQKRRSSGSSTESSGSIRHSMESKIRGAFSKH